MFDIIPSTICTNSFYGVITGTFAYSSNTGTWHSINEGSTDSRLLEHSVTPEVAARMARSYQKELSEADKARLRFINIRPTKAGIKTCASSVHSRELRPKVLTPLPVQTLTRTFGRPHGKG